MHLTFIRTSLFIGQFTGSFLGSIGLIWLIVHEPRIPQTSLIDGSHSLPPILGTILFLTPL